MKRTVLLLVAGLLANEQAASAMPLTSSRTGTNTQVILTGATDCRGPIAGQAHPIIGAEQKCGERAGYRTGLYAAAASTVLEAIPARLITSRRAARAG